MYYERDERGLPLGWIARMKHAVRVAGPQFTARRLLQQYVETCYAPAVRGEPAHDAPPVARGGPLTLSARRSGRTPHAAPPVAAPARHPRVHPTVNKDDVEEHRAAELAPVAPTGGLGKAKQRVGKKVVEDMNPRSGPICRTRAKALTWTQLPSALFRPMKG